MRDYAEIAHNLRCCGVDVPCDDCTYQDDIVKCGSLERQAADAIEELRSAVPHWISVEEQLPTAEDGDPWDRCIVYTDEDTIQTLPLCKVGNGYVTHWMKVEPPKEVE